jgi:hypothetical protein
MLRKSSDESPGLSLGMGHQNAERSSVKEGRLEDALAHTGDEGRSKLR